MSGHFREGPSGRRYIHIVTTDEGRREEIVNIRIELTEQDLKKLVLDKLRSMLGDVELDEKLLTIEVITKENYRANKWERGRFRAIYQ